jgi:histone deacetylase 1/2
MLKVYSRVLYIDIDVHHGDGVEEAFYCTDRVMTFSLHKFGDFFPGTGASQDRGAKEGEGFSLNAPLENGVTDDQYFEELFRPVFDKIMEVYQPGAIFLQCGADSLAADRLGTLNLTTRGHARCVQYVKERHVPTLVAGGGGYTIRNVARVWCYETAVLVDRPDIPNAIPFNNYFEYFAPSYELHLLPENMENLNKKGKIEEIRIDLLQQLQSLQGAPSVAMQQVPPLYERREEKDVADEKEEEEEEDVSYPHKKKTKRKTKKLHGSELYDAAD